MWRRELLGLAATKLDWNENPFGPLPKGIMCPMIMVGTEVATIRGTYFGHPVNITMGKGGCWLTRWTEFGQIFN